MAEEPDVALRPPTTDLIRALAEKATLVRADDDGDEPEGDGNTMHGHFAVFDQWTEIDSLWEGQFMERISPGAFRKTFRENRDTIKVTFQHGRDPQLGDKPLGRAEVLEEDEFGARYEVPLLDAPYVQHDLVPGLREGLYGSSFRFQVMREQFDEEPGESEWNPAGIPERTIKEIRLFEFGPVTFPAYAAATAGMRSLTDEYRLPGTRELLEALKAEGAAAPTERTPAAVEATSEIVRRSTPARDHLAPRRRRSLGSLD